MNLTSEHLLQFGRIVRRFIATWMITRQCAGSGEAVDYERIERLDEFLAKASDDSERAI